MNKVYKLVWSKVQNCYVVVSEIARSHTKAGGNGGVHTGMLSVLIGLSLLGGSVQAAATIDDGAAHIKVDSSIHETAIADGNSIALGEGAAVKNSSGNSVAIGPFTIVDGEGSIAIGSAWETRADRGNEDYRNGNIPRTTVKGSNSMAIGNAETVVAGDNNIAIGAGSRVGVDEDAWKQDYTVQKSESPVANGIAMGVKAQVTTTGGVALGANSVSDREMGVAGYDPSSGEASLNTSSVWKSMTGAVSVGNVSGSVTRQIIGVAAGSEDTDAVNVAQLKALRQDLQTDVANGKTHYYSVRSSAQDADSNYNNDGAKGENALAAGSYASALKDSVAVGHEAQANDMRSVAIGMGAKTFSKADSQAAIDTGGGNTAIGYNAQAGAGDQSGLATAVGKDAKATGWGSSAYGVGADAHSSWSTALGNQSRANETKGIGGTAIGTTAKADEAYATAVGLGAEATAVNSTALGMQAKATQKDSVALGAGSVDRAATKETKGTITLSDGTIRDYGNFAGSNPIGVVSVGAKDKERQIINVAAGKISADSTDAVNGSQLYSLAGEVGKNAEAIAKNTQDISNIKNNITNLTTEAGKHTKVKARMNENLTVTEGTNTEGGKEYTVDLSDKLTIGKAGADGKDGHMGINGKDGVSGVGIDGKDGISVKGDKGEVGINGNDGISIKGKDGKDAVSINGKDGVSINNGPSITKDGIDAGGKTITNIGNGTNATDAVNKGQLDEAVQNTNREVGHVANALNRLDSRVNKVGANAAALAALHPQDFDPDDKWDFAAGYGNYKDAHAIAVGAFYRPNEDTMLSVGGSFGGGENMVNAGITFKLGQKNSVGRSKVAMAKEIIDLKTEVQLLKNQNQTILKALHATGAQEASTTGVTFSDVPQGHWAYTYVKSLADKGYLKGYPDGEFKGDHAMSRYEYAAIIYRALQNGAPLDGNMVQSMKEFKPEIEAAREADRFRVDRISGKDNDRHKVERVRVNSADNKSEKDFRDVYGSQIVK